MTKKSKHDIEPSQLEHVTMTKQKHTQHKHVTIQWQHLTDLNMRTKAIWELHHQCGYYLTM